MSNFKDISGQKFGRLTALYRVSVKNTPVKWLFQCECGTEKAIISAAVKNATTKSCGCWNREFHRSGPVKHGLSRTRIYTTWLSMLSRCEDINNVGYKRHGRRGIKVCRRWHKLENFVKDMAPRPAGKTIERINNNKGYYLGNCTWATPKQQAANRRPRSDRPLIMFKGATRPLCEWAAITGMKKGTINGRWARGWSPEQTLTTPVQSWGR